MNITTALSETIVNVPNWPKQGVDFKDLTPVLQKPKLFTHVIDSLYAHFSQQEFDLIAALDARGFWFAPSLATRLNLGWVPIRKAGKLPRPTKQKKFSLEYGEAQFEIHHDDIQSGQRVLLIDDIIATGGTMVAAIQLVRECGGVVTDVGAIADLGFLCGADKIRSHDVNVTTLIQY